MKMSNLALIEADIRQLTLAEQAWLMEQLAKSIREQTQRQEPSVESQLAPMAADPELQLELRLIEAEFAGTESDGLSGIL
ncbi:MAG: hypothetical protein KIT87_26285 [Anaerolineae bacterium]|nr:hypothetical protein [Anaerolineae bacterium]